MIYKNEHGIWAFPCEVYDGKQAGLTKREYYAGQALMGLLASGKVKDHLGLAETAFLYADDMIREGEK